MTVQSVWKRPFGKKYDVESNIWYKNIFSNNVKHIVKYVYTSISNNNITFKYFNEKYIWYSQTIALQKYWMFTLFVKILKSIYIVNII